jgi:hypothetical protein
MELKKRLIKNYEKKTETFDKNLLQFEKLMKLKT